MSENLERTTTRLNQARQSGDADAIAEALAVHANALIQHGQLGLAQQALEEASNIHSSRGRTYDVARCLQMAGTLCRFQGRLDEAEKLVTRALDFVDGAGPIAVSGYAELGEIAMASGRAANAAAEYQAALDAGRSTGLIDSARATLLRKRAVALVSTKDYPTAVRDLQTAYELLINAGERPAATRTLIEKATALQHARQFTEAEAVIRAAMELAQSAVDHAALADIHLLSATQALEQHDTGAALLASQTARSEALAGNAATSYIGAAHAIAQLREAAGDRLGAYEALAVGWVTLGDLLPKDLARAAFEPKLREMRERWGQDAFDETKKKYEAIRRQALGRV